ncbi:uncharacterized protein LOC126840771 isoform X1 [Adelges cooleyi]|uniref:uncharacterized protein LOC126840771 isoform X1 n=1 Tax=Adelges cooleyi TaxID=133065 RepID=UPI00217F5D04|nr:uncharacterized protein LOC126840771 isoform X1 [Adelges cooleyi]
MKISLNASPMMNIFKNLTPCLNSEPPPKSILNLQTNIYHLDLKLGLEKVCLVNCSALKLDPDYIEEVSRARSLIQKGDIRNGRIALFNITKARTIHKFDKYTDESPYLDNVTVLINVIVLQFIEDVQNGL